MWDGTFEWDDAKAERNWRDHAVSFEMARDAFRDALGIEWVDRGQVRHEERLSLLAMAEGRLLFVAFVMRGETIRIISARRAEAHERRRYHNANLPSKGTT